VLFSVLYHIDISDHTLSIDSLRTSNSYKW